MGLLKDVPIEQTKSRARKCNDNGLVESKTGAVIRRDMEYGYIAARHEPEIEASRATYGVWRFCQYSTHRLKKYATQKGGPRRIASLPHSGPFFDWNILHNRPCFDYHEVYRTMFARRNVPGKYTQ